MSRTRAPGRVERAGRVVDEATRREDELRALNQLEIDLDDAYLDTPIVNAARDMVEHYFTPSGLIAYDMTGKLEARHLHPGHVATLVDVARGSTNDVVGPASVMERLTKLRDMRLTYGDRIKVLRKLAAAGFPFDPARLERLTGGWK